MRKYIIGAIFGFVLSFTISAHAEIVSMINKVVEGTFPVTVDGKKLERDAIVIEGSTYLPVRSFGESIGYDVTFDSELGVKLSNKAVTTPQKEVTATVVPQPTLAIDFSKYRGDTGNPELNKVNGEIEYCYTVLNVLKTGLAEAQKDLSVAAIDKKAFYEDRILKYNKSIPEQEAKIAELEKRKAELEATLPK